MKTRILSLGMSVLLTASIASADDVLSANSLVDKQIQSIVESNKVVFLDGKPSEEAQRQHDIDSVRSVVTEFYYDQFRHFQDPDAPYFLFMSKDAQLAMGIGGAVRMRAYYDWGGAIPASGFAPYLIPMTPDPTNMRAFGTTPAGTCLFFRVIGRNKRLGHYQLYIEANFNGYSSRDFHLKKAYAIINDWTIGYANSTFSDPAAVPPTVDAQGPNNKISPTSVLVRWMPTVKNRWVFALSAETPSTAIDVNSVDTKKVTNWLPDWAAFVQYQWAKGQHLRLSGIVRTLSYRDMHTQKNYNPTGWGLLLSNVTHPIPQLTTYATLSYGKGMESLGGDLQIANYDLIPDPEQTGHLYAPASLGWCVGLQYNFLPNLFMSVSASQSYLMPKYDMPADEYKNGFFGDINVFWNLTPRIQVAAEFDLGRRQNRSGEAKWARRVGAMAQFSF
ncbi:MAG: hypothetical protein K2M03_07520 [Muribaculaceae bacterium]|nr:hypothetical protein [Muribaculaceae bacterium]